MTGDTTDNNAGGETTDQAQEPAEDEGGYTVLTDADGNVYDLGGMEIIIRDCYSPADGSVPEPKDDL